MAYADATDLANALGTRTAAELTADSGSTPDTTKLTEDVNAASAEIDGYLARRYATPISLTVHPELAPLLKSMTLRVAVYNTHNRRQPVPEEISNARKAAVEWGSKVSRGEIVLPAATTPTPATADAPMTSHGGAVRNPPGVREDL